MGVHDGVLRRGGLEVKTLTLRNITLNIHEEESALIKLCSRKLHAPCKYFKIVKKSLDARDKSDIRWVYTLECADEPYILPPPVYEKITKPAPKVVIAGTGPAGLFCALRLIEHGIRPVLVERGKPVEERISDVRRMRERGELDFNSNVQFGEGGAGTFSDGKLFTQTGSPLNREVLKTFLQFGAPPEIEYLGKPHIGSDNLRSVVANMRRHILERGGEVRFSTKLTDVETRGGKLSAVYLNGVREEADELVLAVGHSARDTFEMLHARGFMLEQKEFAVGVRIEHLQEKIGRAQYGESYPLLPAADYKLVSHAAERAVFTFCMCPGGVVIPSASEEGGVVVNGMSDYARAERNANSALVVQVKREDFGGEHPLAGVEFQRKMERLAFQAAGGGYRAPVQLLGDFLERRESDRFQEVLPSYEPATAFAPLDGYLPEVVCGALRAALPDMGRRLSGFDAHDAVLTGVESRTSSPVRVLRGEELQAAGCSGVYPCGEGCGYAGGITSAAADGLRVATAIYKKYA